MRREGPSKVAPNPPSLEEQLAQKNLERAQRCAAKVNKALAEDDCWIDVDIGTVRAADGGFKLTGKPVIAVRPSKTPAPKA